MGISGKKREALEKQKRESVGKRGKQRKKEESSGEKREAEGKRGKRRE